jgi:hypothetical protein
VNGSLLKSSAMPQCHSFGLAPNHFVTPFEGNVVSPLHWCHPLIMEQTKFAEKGCLINLDCQSRSFLVG